MEKTDFDWIARKMEATAPEMGGLCGGSRRYAISFLLTPKEAEAFDAWRLGQLKKDNRLGPDGGRWLYKLTPSTIGTWAVCKDMMLNEEYVMTFEENW